MSKLNICIPVLGDSLEEFLKNLEIAQSHSDFVELRLDYINNLELDQVEIIKNHLKVQAIATCRAKFEGGKFENEENKRLKIIQKCLQLGFDYVDIELATAIKYCSRLIKSTDKPKKKKNQLIADTQTKIPILDLNSKQLKTKIILSFHDFSTTPNYRKLRLIQTKMNSFGCDVCKLACQINSEQDNVNLVRLLTSKSKNESMIVVGIGSKSKFIRIATVLLGGLLTFATVNNMSSASGQLNIDETKELLAKF
jgi:3-dehydroquinate dehydratase